MTEGKFQVGDRVKLDHGRAGTWTQPLRRFAEEGRLGTVTAVDVNGFRGREYAPMVTFDVKRKGAAPVRERFRYDRDLILVDRPASQPKGDTP